MASSQNTPNLTTFHFINYTMAYPHTVCHFYFYKSNTYLKHSTYFYINLFLPQNKTNEIQNKPAILRNKLIPCKPALCHTFASLKLQQLFKSKRLIIKNRKQMKKKIFILEDPEELNDPIPVQQVRNTIKEELADAQKRATKKSTTNTYMSRQEVCELLHISYSTLHRWVNLEILVCYKIGRRSLFKAKEVEATLVKLNVGGGLGYGY